MKIRYKKSEQGSTLITVLIMLILLTIAGTWAIRGSITSLNVSTNAQAQSLLMQSSDSIFVTMENRTNDDLKFAQMRVGDGALAFALRPENKGKELVFCVRGSKNDNFTGSRIASAVYWAGKTIKNSDLGKNGFCKVNRLSDFISGRKTVISQVSIRAADNSADWEHMLEGDDSATSKGKAIQKVIITAVSIIPNLSRSSATEVNDCLSNYTSFVDEVIKNKTTSECLAEKNVPYSVQDMEYTLKTLKAS